MKNALFALVISGVWMINCAAAPLLQIDRNTLWQSSFENSLTEPDYAVGAGDIMGGGARSVPGYSGKGIDLRPLFLQEDFLKNPPSAMGGLNRWTLQMPGNCLPDEGTLEFFVRLDNRSVRPNSMNGGNMFIAINTRTLDLGDKYVGASLRLTRSNMAWQLPLWGKDAKPHWSGSVKFKPRSLKPGWHHFALTWGAGEAVIYIDGRAAASCDLSGYFGLNLMNNLMHGFGFANFVFDELRISNIVRYREDFEPPWLGGIRPAHAWNGSAEPVKRYKFTPREPAEAEKSLGNTFQFNTMECALILREGLKRQKLKADTFTVENDSLRSDFGKIKVRGIFGDKKGQTRTLTLNFENTGSRTARLEFQFGAKPAFAAKSYFDGLQERFTIKYPRYRDSYPLVLPLAALADGENFASIALDPHFPFNDLIHAWRDNTMFCGTKFVLAPGEKFELTLYSSHGKSKYGTAAALDRFYDDYADLYRRNPRSTVYTQLPLANHYGFKPPQDMQRQGYGGGLWGHGPYHTAGDDTGFFWDKKLDPADKSTHHALSWRKRINGPKEKLHRDIRLVNQHEFDNFYGVRLYHGEPDLIADWIVKIVDPAFRPTDDPLHTGQYYRYRRGGYIFNELNTKLGNHILKVTENYFNIGMKGLSPAWINDVFYFNTVARFNDPAAQQTPGRSFSCDMGDFVRGAAGKQRRIKFVNTLESGKCRTDFIADGGSFSYSVAAHVAQSAIESGSIFDILSGMGFVRYSRNLHGEKPISAYNQPTQFDSGRYFDPDNATVELIREVYRYDQQQIVLFALKHAVNLAPASYGLGKQYIAERLPLIVSAVLRGRKAVPGAGAADKNVWVRRSGAGVESLVIFGNDSAKSIDTQISFDPEIFGGVPVALPFFGGSFTGGSDPAPVKIAPFSAEAFLTPVIISGAGKVRYHAKMSGDGINFTVKIELDCEKSGTVKYADFAPLYRIKNAPPSTVPGGKSTLVLEYECPVLKFSAAEWEQVELFRNSKTNFAIVADKNGEVVEHDSTRLALGFDSGTVGLLLDAVKMYDWENGILHDLAMPEQVEKIADVPGNLWKVALNTKAQDTGVWIDPAKKIIYIDGTTSGQARKAMVVFLRLLDRKYPHIGTLMPLSYYYGEYDLNNPLPPEKLRANIKTKNFYGKKAEYRNTLMQPVLHKEYEHLYNDGKNDFTGRYRMLTMPFLLEPTFGDDFVYGYKGANK